MGVTQNSYIPRAWDITITYSPLLCCWQDFKCDKVHVIVAWGKNCREESDKVFAIGYQVCKGTCRVLTVIQLTLLSVSPRLSQSTTITDLVCLNLWLLSVFDVKGEHAQIGYKIVINRARFVVNYKQPGFALRPRCL